MQNSRQHERANRTGLARSWRSHTIDDRWDVYRYAISAVWAVGFIIYTPAALQPVLTVWTTVIPMAVIIVGSVVGAVGRLLNEHLRVELWGVLSIVAGFGFYLLLNLLLVILASSERIVQTVLVLLAMSFALQRLRVLAPRLLDVMRSER